MTGLGFQPLSRYRGVIGSTRGAQRDTRHKRSTCWTDRIYEQSASLSVIPTATSMKAVGLSPVMECSVIWWGVMIPPPAAAQRREEKWACQGKEKEKDRRKERKSPLGVLMCRLAVEGVFAAKVLRRLKCTYSIKQPGKPPASYLATICLQGGGIQLISSEGREEVRADVLVRGCGTHAWRNTRCGAEDIFYYCHKTSLMIASNPFPEK